MRGKPFATQALRRCAAIVTLLLAGSLLAADVGALTGSWQYRGPARSGMWLKTLQEGQRIRFQLEIARGAPSYNSGWIEGEFDVQGGKGTFSGDGGRCEIAFHFAPSSVRISEVEGKQECRFGYNVRAEGRLQRTSRRKPAFSAGDPRVGS